MLPLDEESVKSIEYDQAMIASAIQSAEDFIAVNDVTPIFDVDGVSPSGGRFIIPVAVPEEIASGDDRSFVKDSITTRDLPLPLMWQVSTDDGHKGSVVVGRIDVIERLESGGLGNARGVFDVGPYGREAERMVRGGFLRGVSVDLDQFEAQVVTDPEAELANDNSIKNDKISVQAARLMGITIVPKPAFQECFIMIEEEPTLEIEEAPLPEGQVFEETPDDYEYELAALAASAAPVVPPRSWFKNPLFLRQHRSPLLMTVRCSGTLPHGQLPTLEWDVGSSHLALPHSTRTSVPENSVLMTDLMFRLAS